MIQDEYVKMYHRVSALELSDGLLAKKILFLQTKLIDKMDAIVYWPLNSHLHELLRSEYHSIYTQNVEKDRIKRIKQGLTRYVGTRQ